MTEPLAPDRVASLLESTCALVEAEIAALGDADARWHPARGEWCVNEVVGHLIEADRRGFSGRIRLILDAERPRLVPWDQRAVAKERDDCARVTQSLFMEFMGLRHDGVALVRGLRAADLDRTGVHDKVGELAVRDLLQEWVHHDRNHTRQLLANVQARAWEHMRNARKFSGE